jgi:hypothetical protein
VFPFAANLASLEVLHFIALATGAAGVHDFGVQRFRYLRTWDGQPRAALGVERDHGLVGGEMPLPIGWSIVGPTRHPDRPPHSEGPPHRALDRRPRALPSSLHTTAQPEPPRPRQRGSHEPRLRKRHMWSG